jgi:hypothetical protein
VFEEGAAVAGDDEVSCVGGRTCTTDGTRYVDFEGDGVTEASFSDRDFSVCSLRMNAVLRWQFRPGSTFFLVWQQSRSARASTGDFDFGRDISRLWRAEPENMFIVKFTYWLGL